MYQKSILLENLSILPEDLSILPEKLSFFPENYQFYQKIVNSTRKLSILPENDQFYQKIICVGENQFLSEKYWLLLRIAYFEEPFFYGIKRKFVFFLLIDFL